jgi:hypothetical protein
MQDAIIGLVCFIAGVGLGLWCKFKIETRFARLE